ncbi:MAG: hypothetical protein K2J89_03185 [Clostridia bacterium]|nr:hypothetical protein [Clostridia bacterium]
MDIRNRKLGRWFALLAVIIILSLCLAMALPSVSAVAPSDIVQATAVDSRKASVLNLDQNGVFTDYFSDIITGEQNEFIYFGKNFNLGQNGNIGANAHSGAIKWRVLSKKDDKYSDGSMLLWADYQLGTSSYNPKFDNQNYAFWGTSLIRANLNGGDYPSAVSGIPTLDKNVDEEESWLYNLFETNEILNILPAKSYETKCWGKINSTYATTGIVATADNQTGQYNSTNIGQADTSSAYAHIENGTSVIETMPAGDKLFLLDYYDINNTAYGFGDNGLVYANKVMEDQSWSFNSITYPGYVDRNNNGKITANYLEFLGDLSSLYWLRPAGRDDRAYSNALRVDITGYVGNGAVSSVHGVRPAFNFDPQNVIYATASSIPTIGSGFASVSTLSPDSDKPAYKVYIKAADYVNYNEHMSDAPIVSATDGNVTVTKSGASGSAVILLADKSGSGNVIYQATATFSGSVATATLPSGINASDFSVTVLFADRINGQEYSESIKGSYTVTSPLSIPKSISVDYNGKVQTLDTLKYDLDWYNSLYDDSSAVQIKYFNSEGRELSIDNLPKNADTYEIEFTILMPEYYVWGDSTGGSDVTRKIDFEIKQITIQYPSITGANSKPYIGGNDVRFQLSDDFDPNVINLEWKESYDGVSINTTGAQYSVSAKTVGTYELVATIKPDQAINHKFASTPKIEVTVEPAKIIIEKIVVSGGGNNSAFSISEGTASISADIYVYVNGLPLGSDIVPITIIIPYGGRDIPVSQPINLDASTLPSTSYQLTNQQIINLDELFEGNYTFDVKSEDKNYTVEFKEGSVKPTLTVLPAGQRTNILWKLYEGNSERSNYRTVTELNETGVKNLSNTLTYSGEQFRLEVELPDGYNLDGGCTVEKISGQGSILGQDAGTYRTTIKLVENGQEYSIEWTIDKAKFNLSEVKWQYPDGNLPYTVGGISAVLDESNLPDGLIAHYTYSSIKGTYVGQRGDEEVSFGLEDGYGVNYVLPKKGNEESYDGDFEWTLEWRVVKAVIEAKWITQTMTDDNGVEYTARVLDMSGYPTNIIAYRYYEVNSVSEITPDTPYITKIEVKENTVKTYIAQAVFTSDNGEKYELSGSEYSVAFGVGTFAEELQIKIKEELTYNGSAQNVEIIFEKGSASAEIFEITYYDKNGMTPLAGAPTNVGEYRAEIKIKDGISGYYLAGENVEDGIAIINYAIKQMQIDGTQWNTNHNPPSLIVTSKEVNGIRHEYEDMDGNPLSFGDLKAGNSYRVRAVITDKNNYVFADGSTETEWKEFEVSKNEQLYDPDDPNNPYYPNEDGENPNPDDTQNPDDDKKPIDLGQFGEFMSEYWQPIVTLISILLILIFTGKGLGYASKRRKIKKTIEKKYSAYYAITGTGLFGLPNMTWTIVASIMAGVAVLSFIFMLLEKRTYSKAEEELEEAKEEFERNQREMENKRRDDQMQMMLMGMMGGNANGGAQGGYAYTQPMLGAEDIRGIVSETMTAMLPGVQQLLPQQASSNDELVQKLVEQNVHNEEIIKNLAQGQEFLMKQMSERPREGVSEEILERLLEKLAKPQTDERVVEKEVAATNISEDKINKLVEGQKDIMEKLSKQEQEKSIDKTVEKEKKDENAEKIEMLIKTNESLMRNQEMLMKQIVELTANRNNEKQVVVPIMQQPTEKIIVEKPVPVSVEKVIEKEVKVEVPVEVEKVVEKIVEIPVQKPAPKAKVVTPRLTLDEAYEKLSAKQKKFFDTLKDYALSKDKCKEKKSTYYVLLGQSSVNPLVKLTIKKDTTVALFKMEDEFMKDIRRNASNDGAKIKVKETEVVIADVQAMKAAKDMIDLREDQIERYNEYLKEQRAMKRS